VGAVGTLVVHLHLLKDSVVVVILVVEVVMWAARTHAVDERLAVGSRTESRLVRALAVPWRLRRRSWDKRCTLLRV